LDAQEAFQVINERRGSMYDPLIVDTFVNAYADIAPSATRASEEARSVANIRALGNAEMASLAHIRASSTSAVTLEELERQLRAATRAIDAIDAASQALRQLTPATVYAFYRYIPITNTVRCDAAAGDPHHLLNGFSIRLGERISGWCAANHKTSVNSHAALDLAEIANQFSPPLRSAISTSLYIDTVLLGTLTAYSSREEPFTDSHRYAFERAATLVAAKLASLTQDRTLVSFPNR
jgi:GAF domain-containing protein